MAQSRPEDALPECCRPVTERKGQGFWWGLFYGIVPHTFCILFIVASVVGATVATSVLQQVLYVPYIFQIMVGLALVFATISALLYLKRNGLLSWPGIRKKWRYLGVMYGTTLAANVLLFWVVFPAVANLDLGSRVSAGPSAVMSAQGAGTASAESGAVAGLQTVTLAVDIPCPGHAPLIIGELKKAPGVQTAKYAGPNLFQVSYDGETISEQQILALPVFESFKARVEN